MWFQLERMPMTGVIIAKINYRLQYLLFCANLLQDSLHSSVGELECGMWNYGFKTNSLAFSQGLNTLNVLSPFKVFLFFNNEQTNVHRFLPSCQNMQILDIMLRNFKYSVMLHCTPNSDVLRNPPEKDFCWIVFDWWHNPLWVISSI